MAGEAELVHEPARTFASRCRCGSPKSRPASRRPSRSSFSRAAIAAKEAAQSRERRRNRCTTCAGAGEVRRAQKSFFGQVISVTPCPTCAGEGTIIASPCKKCRGEGRVRQEESVAIKVPPGVATGQYMTMRGVGNVGPRGGGRGDILVVFEVEEDSALRARRRRSLLRSPRHVCAARVRRRRRSPDGERERHAARSAAHRERTGIPPSRPRTSARELVRCRRPSRSTSALHSRRARCRRRDAHQAAR